MKEKQGQTVHKPEIDRKKDADWQTDKQTHKLTDKNRPLMYKEDNIIHKNIKCINLI